VATVNLLVATASGTDGFGITSGSFIPTAGALIVAFVVGTSCTTGTSTMSGSSSVTYTGFFQAVYNSTTNRIRFFYANEAAVAESQTITWSTGADSTNGAAIIVLEIVPGAGESLTFGSAPYRQGGNTSNQTAGNTPTGVLASACLTDNVVLSFVANETNPAGLTAPTDWTIPTGADVGYAGPTTGAIVAYKAGGFTSDTVTWGSTSSDFAIITVEISVTVASGVTPRLALLGVGV
jgi:hypothetical protein